MARILLVEDQPMYRRAAEKYMPRTDSLTFACDYDSAAERLGDGGFDGAMIDCFMPGKKGAEISRDVFLRMIREVESEYVAGEFRDRMHCLHEPTVPSIYGQYEPLFRIAWRGAPETRFPLGVRLAEASDELELPFVLTTSTRRHDGYNELIFLYAGRKGWDFMDFKDAGSKAGSRFWKRASQRLQWAIRRKAAKQ
jgi:hypothetical protein